MLFVLQGPSGSGKTTQAEKLTEDPHFHKITTVTTRSPRAGEVHGRDYYFLSESEYTERLNAGELMAPTAIHGARYGIPKEDLECLIADKSRHAVVVLDDVGARELQAMGAIVICLTLSEEERHLRLKERKEENRFEKESCDVHCDIELSCHGDIDEVYEAMREKIALYL